jgi:cysteine desulfurase
VLTAICITPDRALAALRLTLGRWTTAADIDTAADAITKAAAAV